MTYSFGPSGTRLEEASGSRAGRTVGGWGGGGGGQACFWSVFVAVLCREAMADEHAEQASDTCHYAKNLEDSATILERWKPCEIS